MAASFSDGCRDVLSYLGAQGRGVWRKSWNYPVQGGWGCRTRTVVELGEARAVFARGHDSQIIEDQVWKGVYSMDCYSQRDWRPEYIVWDRPIYLDLPDSHT